jgi:hypothetical protein
MNKLAFASALFFSFLQGIGQEKNIIPLKTTRVSVFKNGTYFSTSEAPVVSKDKVFYFTPPASALNGTFWYALKDAKVQTINVKQYNTSVTKQARSIGEFLASNINTEVTLSLLYGQTITLLKGTILAYYLDPASSAYKILKLKLNDGNIKLIRSEYIVDFTLAANAKSTYVEDSSINLAKVMLDKDISNSMFSTLSIQTGISWVPSYLLKLTDNKKANLDIKATIENDAENIVDVPLSLVVGNPQMFYGKQLDMISGGIVHVYSRTDNIGFNANTTASYDYDIREYGETDNENATGEKSNDLYYYNLGNLNIEKGAKAIVKLSTNDIEYKDLYELDIQDKVNYWQTKVAAIDPNTVYETWHVLKVDNKTTAPFSTGPVFVIDENGKPLAQDEMKYTPVGATTKIKLSKAIDVQTANDEEVIARETSKTLINNREYEVVKIKGKIKVANYQSKQIKISISKTVNGRITNTGGGTTTVLPNRNSNYMNLNDINITRWEKEIKPNETLILEYEYEVLVAIIKGS